MSLDVKGTVIARRDRYESVVFVQVKGENEAFVQRTWEKMSVAYRTYQPVDDCGYDGDDESGASSCSLQQYVRPFSGGLNPERCGLPWTTASSERFTLYTLPRNEYKFIEDLVLPHKRNGERTDLTVTATEITVITASSYKFPSCTPLIRVLPCP
ncbi:hypothetical protein NQ315_006445 [Exocentrus adspersus]|uniref:Uncharacterized protein n=1 Tax=Exocentrus adspersus TaxID=1586481 RepID=A0AAV8W1V3_9CUCU|nr:hypothetical protein NQ315_006445 [Exocentrus adspersus]